MNRVDAIKKIKNEHKDALFIISNGLTSREAANFVEEDNNFYLLHAMGEALSVGKGFASAMPNQDVIVIDGDGNALMGASSWHLNNYDNLYYYILDNGIFATTGGQKLPLNINWPKNCKILKIKDYNFPNTKNPPLPNVTWRKIKKWLKAKDN
jgi:pyruvate/2-oxoacid:ferredoxin oxidoreductase beta subunit